MLPSLLASLPHASLSEPPPPHPLLPNAEKQKKNRKYTQTHHPVSVFYPRPNASIPNANQPWTGRDDTTELYFRDEAHLVSNFASNYTRDVVGPDALNFADVETAISLVARESLAWRRDGTEGNGTADGQGGEGDEGNKEGGRDVALFFIASANGTADGAGLEKDLTPLLVTQLEQEAGDVATELVVNVGFDLKSFDPVSYFGGLRLHALVYKVVMDGEGLGAVAKVRAAQKGFFAKAGGRIGLGDSFAVFGKEGTVLDLGRAVEVSFMLGDD